jgi:hypothetical protein
MKKIFITLAAIMLILTAGCKKEFSKAGYNLPKNENFQFKIHKARVISYNHPVEKVFSANQPLISLGVYRHPAFGLSEADLLINFNSSEAFNSLHFRNADSILFVELRIPFFSEKNQELSTANDPVYDVDSVFGNHAMKIKAYESGYYIFPYDPDNNFQTPLTVYSNFDFLSHTRNLLAEENHFLPDFGYIIDTLQANSDVDVPDTEVKETASKDTLPPHFVLKLDTTFFRNKFFNQAGRAVLTNPELFKNYFRGIYLHVQNINDDGALMLMQNGKIQLVIAYRYTFINNNQTPNDPSDDFQDHAYEEIILHGTSSINIFRNAFYPQVQQKITQSDSLNGEEKLYVKGEAGSMAIFKLFSPTELYELRNNNWLINQVDLRIYVDETEMTGIPEEQLPKRLYLYNFDNNIPLTDLKQPDYTNVEFQELSSVYDGELKTDEETGKRYYDFNITRHIKNVLRKDSANVRLGLRVISNLEDFIVKYKQYTSPDAYNPFGTVLRGNRSNEDAVELRIYYTEPGEEN